MEFDNVRIQPFHILFIPKIKGIKRPASRNITKSRKRVRLHYFMPNEYWTYNRIFDDQEYLDEVQLKGLEQESEMELKHEMKIEQYCSMYQDLNQEQELSFRRCGVQDMLNLPIYSILDEQQRDHAIRQGNFAQNHLVIFDPSETGTGKTYAAFGLAEQLKYHQNNIFPRSRLGFPVQRINMFIITVKAVIPEFLRLASDYKFCQSICLIGIANLDLLVLGKCYILNEETSQLVKVKNPYLTVINENNQINRYKGNVVDENDIITTTNRNHSKSNHEKIIIDKNFLNNIIQSFQLSKSIQSISKSLKKNQSK